MVGGNPFRFLIPDRVGELDAVFDAQFLVNIIEMTLDRLDRDEQRFSDFRVRFPEADEPNDVLFSGRDPEMAERHIGLVPGFL
jgi:hypothetical protein